MASVTFSLSLANPLVTDKNGVVLEDDRIGKNHRYMVFERDTTLADPNWKLVETRIRMKIKLDSLKISSYLECYNYGRKNKSV